MKWEEVELGEVLSYEQPNKYIVEDTNYHKSIGTPVLTAGKTFLLGYTDENTGIFDKGPCIIFDDFTTAFHFVGFPFKVKSSAMKILQADESRADLKFLYYRMLKTGVDTTLHKRYWISKYSKLKIPLPPLPVQQKIAAILDAADDYRSKTKALLDKYDLLTQSIFLEMFGDPVRNEMGWKKVSIGEFASVSSGSTPSRKIDNYFAGNIPWIKTGEVKGNYITETEEHISPDAMNNSSCKLYPINSILIAMYGQGKTRGNVAITKIKATTNQACAVIEPSNNILPLFLFHQLKLNYHDLRDLGRGGNQPNLNGRMIKNYEVIIPPLDMQILFKNRCLLNEKQISVLESTSINSESLFQSLLQKAFKGELVS